MIHNKCCRQKNKMDVKLRGVLCWFLILWCWFKKSRWKKVKSKRRLKRLTSVCMLQEFRGMSGYRPTACVPALELTRQVPNLTSVLRENFVKIKAPRAVLRIRIRVKIKGEIRMESKFREQWRLKMELWRAVYTHSRGGEAQKWSRVGSVDKR